MISSHSSARSLPTLSVVIATYQGAQYVEGWFRSLAAQTYPIHEIIVIENSVDSSTLNEIEHLRSSLLRVFPQGKNLDFAAGYNLGMRKATGDYICILNQDLELEPTACAELVAYLRKNPQVGAASPALLRFGSTREHPIIDSLGISLNRFRKFWNIGEGEERLLPTEPQEVFALTGAAMCFSRATLERLDQVSHEYFDELFVAYKEDIDLSYRIRHLGLSLYVVPQSVMYHKRTAQELKELSMLERRRQKSFRIRGNSLKNQWWVLLKNEPWSTLILHAPWICLIEFLRLCYIVCTEPSTLLILPMAMRQLPSILRKRRAIQRSSVISPKILRLWIQ